MADVAELRRLLTSVAWHSWEAHDDGTASCRIDLPMAGVRSAAEAEAAIREVANALPALLAENERLRAVAEAAGQFWPSWWATKAAQLRAVCSHADPSDAVCFEAIAAALAALKED